MTTQSSWFVGQATRESILLGSDGSDCRGVGNGFSLRDLGRQRIFAPRGGLSLPSKEAILRSAIQRHEEMNAPFDAPINEEGEGGSRRGRYHRRPACRLGVKKCASP